MAILLEAVTADLLRFLMVASLIIGAGLLLYLWIIYIFFPFDLVGLFLFYSTGYHFALDHPLANLVPFHILAHATVVLGAGYYFGYRKTKGLDVIRTKTQDRIWLGGWLYRLVIGASTFAAFAALVELPFCTRYGICWSSYDLAFHAQFAMFVLILGIWTWGLVALTRLLAKLVKRAARRAAP